jgi:multiple sugar transport system substrate-binding protein
MMDRAQVTRRGLLGMGVAAGIMTLTACGSDSDKGSSNGSASLVMTVWGGDSDRTAYQQRIDLLVKKYPELSVKLQLIPQEYAQKVQTMIAGGNGPDIMEVAENVNVYSSKNQLLPLDDLAKKAGLDVQQRFDAIGSIYSYKDKLYAIPDRSGAMIVYYNKGLFDKAGIKPPSVDWTWNDALEAFKALTIPGKQWGYGGAGWWAQWWSFVYQNGGKIIDPATGRPTVNSDQVVEALQWAGDLVNKHGVVPTAKQYADMGPNMGGDPAFASGKVAVNTTGFWAISGLAKSTVDWDIAPMWRGPQQAVTAFGSGLAISRTAKNPEAAFKAINFLTSPEAQPVIIGTGQDVPANVEVQKSDAFLKPAWMTKSVNMNVFAQSAPFIYRAPFIPEWNEMQKAFDDGLANFWLGKQDARAALNDIQKRLETIVKPAG